MKAMIMDMCILSHKTPSFLIFGDVIDVGAGKLRGLPVILLLVAGLEHFLFFHILGIVTATDFHIFQRGGSTTINHQPDYHCTIDDHNPMVQGMALDDFHCEPPGLHEAKGLFGVYPRHWKSDEFCQDEIRSTLWLFNIAMV